MWMELFGARRLRLIYLVITMILLAITFLKFSPSIGGAISTFDAVSQVIDFREIEVSPVLVKIRVKVLEADMGFSREFMGNETGYEFRPVGGALVLVMDGAAITTGPAYILRLGYFGFTNDKGEIVLSAPRGNFTIMINPRPYHKDPECFWRGPISVEGNETIVVRFILYRLNPVEIDVNARRLDSETLVKMKFKLPINGSYYIGTPIVAYYTSMGDVKLYREDKGDLPDLWRLSGAMTDLWINPRIHYLTEWPGGAEVVRIINIRDFSAYILPSMTYLPVERVTLEELKS